MADYDVVRKSRARREAKAERERLIAEGVARHQAEVAERVAQFRRRLAATVSLRNLGWSNADLCDLIDAPDARAWMEARGVRWEDVAEAVGLVAEEWEDSDPERESARARLFKR